MSTERHDPGAYIGHEPEFDEETIPGGEASHVSDDDVRRAGSNG